MFFNRRVLYSPSSLFGVYLIGVFSIRQVLHSACSSIGVFSIRQVLHSACSSIGVFSIRQVLHSACCSIGVFSNRQVLHSACSSIGMFSNRQVLHSACSSIGLKIKPPWPQIMDLNTARFEDQTTMATNHGSQYGQFTERCHDCRASHIIKSLPPNARRIDVCCSSGQIEWREFRASFRLLSFSPDKLDLPALISVTFNLDSTTAGDYCDWNELMRQ
ncbi:hypothetical protein RRG08_010159 [Elysia crispata]|uniref:Uncharacterized protein n=1 Tax=Elysia crispata TaxID=231223 RepID=A0AAE1E0C4_9GAST|nr:hypothetical protein RRG08_010159 [Elysia crispata]